MRFAISLSRRLHWLCWGLILGFGTLAVAGSLVLNAKLPDTLYKNEHWKGGSAAAERIEFLGHALQVMNAQQRILADPIKGRADGWKKVRVFHAKSHGCFTGRIEMNSVADRKLLDPDSKTQVGLFLSGTSYPVVVRFANGAGWIQPDWIGDLRGVGVKLLDVHDPVTGADINVDLTAVNQPNPPGKDQQGLIDVMEAAVGGVEEKARFAKANPALAEHMLKTQTAIPSIATATFWSGHAYLMGPDLAMKFNLVPEAGNHAFPLSKAEKLKDINNYLRADLKKKSAKHPLKWAINVQLEKTPETTPIENTLGEWREADSPSIRVGTLILDTRDSSENESWCEDLRFNPGHFHPLHRPLGNMGRGRVFTYEASQLGRLVGAAPDPVLHGYQFAK